jgi:hypothetical protein
MCGKSNYIYIYYKMTSVLRTTVRKVANKTLDLLKNKLEKSFKKPKDVDDNFEGVVSTVLLLKKYEDSLFKGDSFKCSLNVMKRSIIQKYLDRNPVIEQIVNSQISLRYKYIGLYSILDILSYDLYTLSKDKDALKEYILNIIFNMSPEINEYSDEITRIYDIVDVVTNGLLQRISNCLKNVSEIIKFRLQNPGNIMLSDMEEKIIFEIFLLFNYQGEINFPFTNIDFENKCDLAVKTYKELIKFVFVNFVSGFYIKIHELMNVDNVKEIIKGLVVYNLADLNIPGIGMLLGLIDKGIYTKINNINMKIMADAGDTSFTSTEIVDINLSTKEYPEGSIISEAKDKACYIAQLFLTSEISNKNVTLEYILLEKGIVKSVSGIFGIHNIIHKLSEYLSDPKIDFFGVVAQTGFSILPLVISEEKEEKIDYKVGQWGLLLPLTKKLPIVVPIEYPVINEIKGDPTEGCTGIWTTTTEIHGLASIRKTTPLLLPDSPPDTTITDKPICKLTLQGYKSKNQDNQDHQDYYACNDIFSFEKELEFNEGSLWFKEENKADVPKPKWFRFADRTNPTRSYEPGDKYRDFFLGEKRKLQTTRQIIAIVNQADYIDGINKSLSEKDFKRPYGSIPIGYITFSIEDEFEKQYNHVSSVSYRIYQDLYKLDEYIEKQVTISNRTTGKLEPLKFVPQDKIHDILHIIQATNLKNRFITLVIEPNLKDCPKEIREEFGTCVFSAILKYDFDGKEFIVPRSTFFEVNDKMNDYIVYTKTGDQPIELIPKTPFLVDVEKVKEKAASFSKKVADSVKSSFTFGRKAPRPSAPSFLPARKTRRSANESNTKDSWDNNSYRPAGGGKRRKTKRKNHKSKRLQKRGARNKTRKRH